MASTHDEDPSNGATRRTPSLARSEVSNLTILSRSPSAVPAYLSVPNPHQKTRVASPVGSDLSELTVLSRSPSPVPAYNELVIRKKNKIADLSPGKVFEPTGDRDRFAAQNSKRALSPAPDKPEKKTKNLKNGSTRTSRTVQDNGRASLSPAPMSPVPWVVGEDGFGTLTILPKEIRLEIFALAFDIHRPVVVKDCCGPDISMRTRNGCRKHGISVRVGVGRFNILQVSQAICKEASWVFFNKGTLLLNVDNALAPYLYGYKASSPRYLPEFAQLNKKRTKMWVAVARFRSINICIPESILKYGDQRMATEQLLISTILLCKLWARTGDVAPKFVRVCLGSLFLNMLPFNMESQAEDRYGELLNWLFDNCPDTEPDFEKIFSDSEHNLQRMLSTVGKYGGKSQWKISVDTRLDDADEGGEEALDTFHVGCVQNGVVFEKMV